MDLLFRISTTITTPSSQGISGAIRISCVRPEACVTEAILSTTTLRMALIMAGAHGRAPGAAVAAAPAR